MIKKLIPLFLFFTTINLNAMLVQKARKEMRQKSMLQQQIIIAANQKQPLTKQQIYRQTSAYLGTLLDKNFDEIKTTFQQLPREVRCKILQSCGDAKSIIFLALSPQDLQRNIAAWMLDFDNLSINYFYTLPIKCALTEYSYAKKKATWYPINLPRNKKLPVGTYFRLTNRNCQELQRLCQVIKNNPCDTIILSQYTKEVIPQDLLNTIIVNRPLLIDDISVIQKANHTTTLFFKKLWPLLYNNCQIALALSISMSLATGMGFLRFNCIWFGTAALANAMREAAEKTCDLYPILLTHLLIKQKNSDIVD